LGRSKRLQRFLECSKVGAVSIELDDQSLRKKTGCAEMRGELPRALPKRPSRPTPSNSPWEVQRPKFEKMNLYQRCTAASSPISSSLSERDGVEKAAKRDETVVKLACRLDRVAVGRGE